MATSIINKELGIQRKLLWTNQDPTQTFSSQTISLDLSTYKFVVVYFRINTSINSSVSVIGIPLGYDVQAIGKSGANMSSRICTIKNNAIDFYGGSKSDGTTDNSLLVPLRVFGLW